jgi:ribosomal protein S18 acetylase RimI-like enzyme
VSDPAGIELRDATLAEAAALLRMMRTLAEQEPGTIEFDEPSALAALKLLLAEPRFGRAWVLWDGRTPVGYVVLTISFSFEYRGRDAFIDELYIEPAYRRRGLGRMAMEFAEQRAKELGVNAVHLEVDHGNDPAMELYRKIGYADHDRHLMTKWLRKNQK